MSQFSSILLTPLFHTQRLLVELGLGSLLQCVVDLCELRHIHGCHKSLLLYKLEQQHCSVILRLLDIVTDVGVDPQHEGDLLLEFLHFDDLFFGLLQFLLLLRGVESSFNVVFCGFKQRVDIFAKQADPVMQVVKLVFARQDK